MKRRTLSTLFALAVVAVVTLTPAGASLAQEEEGAVEDATTVTEGFEPGREPAVVLSDAGAEEDDPAWTFRYLVPTLLVVSGLALAGLIVWYGFGVKGRYRVVR